LQTHPVRIIIDIRLRQKRCCRWLRLGTVTSAAVR
jgi:hypothetical protein